MELKAELDWLAEEFESLSHATEDEYSVGSGAAFEAHRKRAADIIARLKLLVEEKDADR